MQVNTGPAVAMLDAVRECLGGYRDFNETRDSLTDIVEKEHYLYTYFLPDNDFRGRYDRDHGCLIVGGKESSQFFGFFDDFYRALSALVSDPTCTTFNQNTDKGFEELRRKGDC